MQTLNMVMCMCLVYRDIQFNADVGRGEFRHGRYCLVDAEWHRKQPPLHPHPPRPHQTQKQRCEARQRRKTESGSSFGIIVAILVISFYSFYFSVAIILNLENTVEWVTDINENTVSLSSEPLLVPLRVQLMYRQHILREIRANVTSHVSDNTH